MNFVKAFTFELKINQKAEKSLNQYLIKSLSQALNCTHALVYETAYNLEWSDGYVYGLNAPGDKRMQHIKNWCRPNYQLI